MSDWSLEEPRFLEGPKVADLPPQVIGITTIADELLHDCLRITLCGNSFLSFCEDSAELRKY